MRVRRLFPILFLPLPALPALCGCERAKVQVQAGAPRAEANAPRPPDAPDVPREPELPGPGTAAQGESAAPLPEAGGTQPFRFPDDLGGRLLADLLPPPQPPHLGDPHPAGRTERAVPPELANPAPLPPAAPLDPPALPTPPLAPARPAPFREHVPDGIARDVPALPVRIELPAAPPRRHDGPDPAEPPPLSPLGTRAPDRAPLGDPTEVYSARAAVNPEPPLKAAAAPFVPIDLPNPFRAGDEVRLRTPPVDPATALGTAPSPRP